MADGALEQGGEVIGVIVESMNTHALAHAGLSSLEVRPSLHQHKARMYELAQGFIALPGGFGTFDELFETLTWAQIGEHNKPVGLLNVKGYFDRLLAALDYAVAEGFVLREHRQILACESDPESLLGMMARQRYPAEAVKRWLRQA